jgi:hypothetical protein
MNYIRESGKSSTLEELDSWTLEKRKEALKIVDNLLFEFEGPWTNASFENWLCLDLIVFPAQVSGPHLWSWTTYPDQIHLDQMC